MRAVFAVTLAALAPAAWANCELDYRFVARWDTEPRRFDATLTLPAGDRTQTLLQVSPEWGGVSDFHRAIRDVRAGAVVLQRKEPVRWEVSHPASGRLTVRYTVVNDVADLAAPLHHRDFYRVLFGPTFFHVFGHALFLVPEGVADAKPVETCIRFEGLPRDARFASSFGGLARAGTASVRQRLTSTQIAASVFVAGDFRVLRRQIAGRPLVIALRGRWGFTDEQFADATAAIVKAHRAFWRDFDFPRFLITLLPNRLERGSTGGTAITDAFATHASNDFTVPGTRFEYLIGHEHVHTWLPRRIGAMPDGGDEPLHYWFSEGFTNYLSHRLLVTAGLWDLRDYARAMNDVIARYTASRFARMPNAEVAPRFWKDASAHDLPYLRGELLAVAWARRLESHDASLEAILRELRLPRAAESGPLAVDRLRTAVKRAAGAAAAADLTSHIERGEPFRIDESFLGPCFEGTIEPRLRFELGFDGDASGKTRRVTGVVAGSAAEQAGLRDGMAFEGWSVTYGDLNRDATVKVRDGDTVRAITYRPATLVPVDTVIFRPRPEGGAHAACRHWIDG